MTDLQRFWELFQDSQQDQFLQWGVDASRPFTVDRVWAETDQDGKTTTFRARMSWTGETKPDRQHIFDAFDNYVRLAATEDFGLHMGEVLVGEPHQVRGSSGQIRWWGELSFGVRG